MQLVDLLDCHKTFYIDEDGKEIKLQRFNVQILAKKIEEKILGVRIKDSIKDNSFRARSLARLAL